MGKISESTRLEQVRLNSKCGKRELKLVLVKNENYFEADGKQKLPYLDAIAITFNADKQSAFLEFFKR